jgi:hypothetical protein
MWRAAAVAGRSSAALASGAPGAPANREDDETADGEAATG